MNFLMMSLKNVLRAKGRAIMTLSILSLGIMIFIFYGTFVEGFMNQSIQGSIDEEISHIRIRALNYDEDLPLNETNMFYTSSDALDKIEGISYTPRLTLSADLDNYEDTLPIVLIGIDSTKDEQVFTLTSTSGEPLGDTAWLGGSVARDMGVNIGDYVNLTFRSPIGAYISGEYEVGGIINSGNPLFSTQGVVIALEELQSLIGTNLISFYSIKLDDKNQLDSIASQVKKDYPNNEVLTWLDLTEDLRLLMEQKDGMLGSIYFIIALIAFLGLMNSILISVWEKRKNTGTLRALGYKDKDIIKIFVYEGFWIGLAGSILGVVLGILLNIPLSTIGINYGALATSGDGATIDFGFYVPNIIRSVWNPVYFVGPLFVIPIVAMLVSYFPAKKSIQMSIVDCIRNKD